jgi:hypothetical protein
VFLWQHRNEISPPVQFCHYSGVVYVPENGRTVFRRNVDVFSNNGVKGVTFLLFCSLVQGKVTVATCDRSLPHSAMFLRHGTKKHKIQLLIFVFK